MEFICERALSKSTNGPWERGWNLYAKELYQKARMGPGNEDGKSLQNISR